MSQIKIEFIPRDKIQSILPLLEKLDSKISRVTLQEHLNQMLEHNYQCIGVYDDEHLIGISGLWTLYKYYMGKHIEPDNVIILPEYRDKGIGRRLVQWIEQYALEQGCRSVELNCYVANDKGRKFWEREGYIPLGMHYQKKLKS